DGIPVNQISCWQPKTPEQMSLLRFQMIKMKPSKLPEQDRIIHRADRATNMPASTDGRMAHIRAGPIAHLTCPRSNRDTTYLLRRIRTSTWRHDSMFAEWFAMRRTQHETAWNYLRFVASALIFAWVSSVTGAFAQESNKDANASCRIPFEA